MKILLVNDDGISARGILALRDAAVRRGHQVFVCAPATQQSGKGQSINLDEPIFVERVEMPGVTAFAIGSTPTDCVRLATDNLLTEKMDAALSGINNGYNDGTAVYYSGTVGAAREAALSGMLSIASSIDVGASDETLACAAEETVKLAERLQNKPVPYGCVVNLNFPASPAATWGKMALATLDDAHFIDRYEERESPRRGTYYWLAQGGHRAAPKEGTDCFFLQKGTPTCTFMTNARGKSEEFAGLLAD